MKAPLFAAAFLLASTFAVQADIRVTIAEGERDARSIARYIEQLGKRYLKPGQDLRVEILDYRPSRGSTFADDPFWGSPGWQYGFNRYGWVGPRHFHSFHGPDWPARLRVKYSFSEKGRKLASATETISSRDQVFRHDRFDDEGREAVRSWFRKRFVQRVPLSG